MVVEQTELNFTTHPDDVTGNTQLSDILLYMGENGSITPLEALSELGIYRLGARIWDLRQAGFKIDTEYEPFITRYGRKSKYARYSFSTTG